jgi:hypothetical protein
MWSQTGQNFDGAIKGLVIPEQWDSEGQVVAITIQTSREEIYFVAPNATGQEMLGFVHQEVEANGKFTERLNGTTMIIVEKFRPVNADTIGMQV